MRTTHVKRAHRMLVPILVVVWLLAPAGVMAAIPDYFRTPTFVQMFSDLLANFFADSSSADESPSEMSSALGADSGGSGCLGESGTNFGESGTNFGESGTNFCDE